MIIHKRRFQGIIAVVILFVVMVGGLFPDPFVIHDNSQAAPAKMNAFKAFRTHFNTTRNYAAAGPLLRGIIEYELGSSSNRNVYLGENGRLYYAGDHVPAQSAGAIYRKADTLHFVEMATILNRELQRRNARMLVAVPPNAQSVATRDLPAWSSARAPFEYDLALAELGRRGVATVDLKATFLGLADADTLYQRTDTHWTALGAVLAFNMAVERAGHPEWKMDPKATLGPVASVRPGDLARFLGLQLYLKDEAPDLLPGPGSEWQKLDILRSAPYAGIFDPYAYERRNVGNGARVLVLGDSFTRTLWLPLLQRSNAQRIGWLHHGICSFDFADVERFDPTLVILAPTEREMPCPEEDWPLSLPRA